MEVIAQLWKEQWSQGTPLGKWCLMVCLTIGNVPGMLCMISEVRGGKDLLHNLTTTVVKNVSLPVGGSHLSLLSFAGVVHIIYHTPTSCCLLLLSFIIF